MKIKRPSFYLIQLIVLTAISSFQPTAVAAQTSKGWEVEFHNIGTHSSPRAADLNNDGIKDLIIGCSKKEFQQNDTAVMAVDGATGKILWKSCCTRSDVWFRSITGYNHDSIPDVVIGGRAAELQAINGKNGKVLWGFFPKRK
jgi:hypothetical protein